MFSLASSPDVVKRVRIAGRFCLLGFFAIVRVAPRMHGSGVCNRSFVCEGAFLQAEAAGGLIMLSQLGQRTVALST